jgi:hypothetical protein
MELCSKAFLAFLSPTNFTNNAELCRSRDNRQFDVRGKTGLMIDCLQGDRPGRILSNAVAGIHVAVKHREVAAGYFQANTVTAAKYLAGFPQQDDVFKYLTGDNRLRVFNGFKSASPLNAFHQVIGQSVRVNINQFSAKISVRRRS